jgi:hypothetical protein
MPSTVSPSIPTAQSQSSLPAGTKDLDLLYVSGASDAVRVFSYPHGASIATLKFKNKPNGICTGVTGKVFVTTASASRTGTIYEFEHGAGKPMAEFSDSGQAVDCSVDPRTGNLAVANAHDSDPNGAPDVAVYVHKQSPPIVYKDAAFKAILSCTYDDASNLIVQGRTASGSIVLAELPDGASGLKTLSTSQPLEPADGNAHVQWDGRGFVAVTIEAKSVLPTYVYRLQLSGYVGIVKKTAKLARPGLKRWTPNSWIYGSTIILPANRGSDLGFWAYPSGGAVKRSISNGAPGARYEAVSPAR